jgi:microcystin-dependent protein
VGATTLSTAQIPSHSHVQQAVNTANTGGGNLTRGTNQSPVGASNDTQATGGGGSHDHSVTRNLKYYDFIIATKN